MFAPRILLRFVTLAAVPGALLALAIACDTTGAPGSNCAEEPEPACAACPEAGPNVAVCEQNVWVCPATGPCSEDAGFDAGPESGPAPEAGPPTDGASDGAQD